MPVQYLINDTPQQKASKLLAAIPPWMTAPGSPLNEEQKTELAEYIQALWSIAQGNTAALPVKPALLNAIG